MWRYFRLYCSDFCGVETPVVVRPGIRQRLLRKLLRAVSGLVLSSLCLLNVYGLQPEDQFPQGVVSPTRFEKLQFEPEQVLGPEQVLEPEQLPAPPPKMNLDQEQVGESTDSQTMLAPDQPGNIELGAGRSFNGLEDQTDTVLDPNQVGNLMTRLDALENAGEGLPLIRLSGFFQLDDGIYGQNTKAQNYFGDMLNGVGFRRARLQAIGKATESTAFTIEMDFGLSGRPSFVDVWGEQADLPFFGTIRVGQFRQPGTMDSWTSIRHLNFLERSAPFMAFDPFRRVGIMSYAMSEDERTSWAYSVYGTGLTFFNAGFESTYQTFGDNTTGTQLSDDGGVTFSSRLTHLIHYDEPSDGRYLLHVGTGFIYSQLGGDSNTNATFAKSFRSSTFPEFFVGDPSAGGKITAAGTPLVLDTGRFQATDFTLYHFELAFNRGQFNFQSEVMLEPVNQKVGPLLLQSGAYMQCGYFLTGEHANYLKQAGVFDYNVNPFTPFFGTGRKGRVRGWGAWEVAFRWSYVDMANRGYDTANNLPDPTSNFAPPEPQFGVLNESTLALNWWWNRSMRLQLNWIHSMPNYTGRTTSKNAPTITGLVPFDIIGARFQAEF